MSKAGVFLLLFSCSAWAQCTGTEPIATTIPVVRGQGSPSACVGKAVTVSGVVTASIGGLQGFFVQDPIGDGDPTTSDAIFVFTGSADGLPDPGSMVQVTGKVVEQQRAGATGSVTEIDATGASFQVTGVAPLPAPVALDPGLDPATNSLTPLEGMLVQYPASTVVTPSDVSGAFYALRNDRLPDGVRVTSDNPGSGMPLMIDTAGGALVHSFNELDTAAGITGVLHFDYGAFRLQPLAAYDGVSTGIAAAPAPADEPYLSVATLDCQGLSKSMPDPDRQTRIAKLALAIQNELGSPELIAVERIADAASITELAQKAGNYLGLYIRGCNTDGSSVGLLFNIDRITPISAQPFDLEAPQLKLPTCTLSSGEVFTNPLFETPLLRVDLSVDLAVNVTLIIADWRSAATDSATQSKLGVVALTAMLASVDSDNIIVLGDFNQPETSPALTSFEKSSGFFNSSRNADSGTRYSVTNAGVSQALDHIFVNPAMANVLLSSGFAHYNADFSVLPNRQDATSAIRASDHDSAFVHLQIF